MRRRPWLVPAFVALLGIPAALFAQETLAPTPSDGTDATLWVQQSAEYRACALQTYRLAGVQLRAALEDKSWTASMEQQDKGGFEKLPPAIILDNDETTLDNSDFQAWLIKTGGSYTPELWQAWVDSAQGGAVPGAVELCQAAKRLGVAVFYVTNRKPSEVAGTQRNLEKLGFPVAEGSIRPRTGDKDKGPRRAEIAQSYRILLLIGDAGGDFASALDSGEGVAGNESRRTWAGDHAEYWGTRWIILPNPMYGRWLDNLVGKAAPAEREAAKWAGLKLPATPVVVAPKTNQTPPAPTNQTPPGPSAPGMSGQVQGQGQ